MVQYWSQSSFYVQLIYNPVYSKHFAIYDGTGYGFYERPVYGDRCNMQASVAGNISLRGIENMRPIARWWGIVGGKTLRDFWTPIWSTIYEVEGIKETGRLEAWLVKTGSTHPNSPSCKSFRNWQEGILRQGSRQGSIFSLQTHCISYNNLFPQEENGTRLLNSCMSV